MPRYDYRCPAGHEHERFRPIPARDDASPCPICLAGTVRLMAAPHVPVDGIYSYAPNVGSDVAFERKRTALKDGVKVYPKEST